MFREVVGDFANYWLTFRGYSGIVLGAGKGENGISKEAAKSHLGIKVREKWNHLKPLTLKKSKATNEIESVAWNLLTKQ